MEKNTSKNTDIFYSIFSGIKVILNIAVMYIFIIACVYIYQYINYSNLTAVLYAKDNIDYTINIKELDEKDSLVEVYIENKAPESIIFGENALSIYKYNNIDNGVYKTSKIATINLLDEDNELYSFKMNGVSHTKIQFKIPKELTTEEYEIDFDTVIGRQSDLVKQENYYISHYTETEAKINNNVKN